MFIFVFFLVPAASSFGWELHSAVLMLKKKVLPCQAYVISKMQDSEGGLRLSEAALSVW